MTPAGISSARALEVRSFTLMVSLLDGRCYGDPAFE
jgi:hypothetical protein